MKNKVVVLFLIISAYFLVSFAPVVKNDLNNIEDPTIQEIINSYKKNISLWPKPTIDKGVEWKEFASIQRDTAYFTTHDRPEVILGKMLFFDPKLSGSNQISCSSCHDPEMGWTDRRKVSLGNNHLEGTRNTQSLYNIAERTSFFWDGRASTLEDQANGPLSALHEMDMDVNKLPEKLSQYKGYKKLFKDAFGDEKVTNKRINNALAAFQKSIKSQPSRFDKFIDGDYNKLTDQEIYGMHLFRTKARCMNCHNGKYLTDESFHNIGLTYYKRKFEDLGRYEITKKAEDVGRFKTPSLRDLLNTSPWMHNGFFDDLDGLINLYNSGMHMIDPTAEEKAKDPLYPYTDPLLKPLSLTRDEKAALKSFLEAMNGSKFKMDRPKFPLE
ncbi:cytochrome c peroxidase [Chishuiella changwenlii]|uniref:Cytochrome c peroxidase n=1 Tax=Chishuiella changwenlii TaxID=1434701 RepID=A0A1M6V2U2_9FLAO|nr:cytochrome c peroxidase [Chishuiella changwenlii]GGF01994.1 methylamine utilization protein [Chishuiella changwenlii]SHK75770.1 cytochrome c peroxidase [Chishuiella changwenlii]